MNVLIVDDDPDITKLYSTALEGEGFKIDTYNDPRKKLYQISNQTITIFRC